MKIGRRSEKKRSRKMKMEEFELRKKAYQIESSTEKKQV